MAPEIQRRAFISYSRINKDFASKLTKGLRTAGYPVWFDLFDIPTGARWDDEVEKALRECSIFMVILTPASIASENVKDEIGYAIDHGKRILPVLLEECDVPLRLRRFQYVDFTTKSFEEGFASAKELLGDLIGDASGPIPTKAPVVEAPKESKPEPAKEKPALAIPFKKTEPASTAVTQKKPMSKGLVIGIVAAAVIGIAGIGIVVSSLSGGGSDYPSVDYPATEAPAATEAPVIDNPATEAPVATEAPAATEAPTAVDNTIFIDDFSDPNNSNWGDITPGWSYFENGKYYMVTENDSNYHSNSPSPDFSQYGPDLWIVTHVTYVSDGRAGIYCRDQGSGFYLFQMDFVNSSAQIFYNNGSDWERLADQSITQANDYELVAGCVGSSLDFYVNGENIHADDDRLSGAGQVGLYTESSNPSGTTIEFDDFAVYFN